jgi:PGF-pre-PGF domain-containing protein
MRDMGKMSSSKGATEMILILVISLIFSIVFGTILVPSQGGPICGNDLIEGNETCDGSDLANQTCISQGFDGGTLACQSNCSGFDTTSCITFQCGNDLIEGNETCDGTDLNNTTCIDLGYSGGNLACLADCSYFNTSGCSSGSNQTCGNSIKEGNETCDYPDLGGEDCISQGFDGGNLTCLADCTDFNTSQCFMFQCGNSIKEGNETCDYPDLGGLDCTSFGFYSGLLGCLADCTDFNTSPCDANFPPSNITVYINSSGGTNYYTEDLNCFGTIDDPNGDILNVTVRWYREGIFFSELDYEGNYPSGSFFSAYLNSTNTNGWETWKCAIRLYDGVYYTDWQNSTNTLYVIGDPGGDPPPGGGGGPTGGGGGSPGSGGTGTSQSQYWDIILPGKQMTMDINTGEIPITNIGFALTETVQGPEIKVEVLSQRPSELPAVWGKAFKYIRIGTNNIVGKLAGNTIIGFRLPNTLVTSTTKDNVKLYRYSSQWDQLQTYFVSSDSSYFNYEALSPQGLSVFAVSFISPSGGSVCGDGVCDDGEICSADCDKWAGKDLCTDGEVKCLGATIQACSNSQWVLHENCPDVCFLESGRPKCGYYDEDVPGIGEAISFDQLYIIILAVVVVVIAVSSFMFYSKKKKAREATPGTYSPIPQK